MRGIMVAAMIASLSAPALAQSVEERMPTCLACHGENGQSQTSEVPSLGGQPEFYLTIQLYMFREKLRVVEIMNETTKGLSDDDLRGRRAALVAGEQAQENEPHVRAAEPLRQGGPTRPAVPRQRNPSMQRS